MREEASHRVHTASGSCSSSSSCAVTNVVLKDGSGFEAVFGRGKCKLWALVAIVFLALCSMLTSSSALKWAAGDINHASQDFDLKVHRDLDVLDLEERSKTVREMWTLYTQNFARLQAFWRDAFGAAYEELTSEVPSVREAALRDIAKMSFHSRLVHDSPPRKFKAEGRQKFPLGKSRKLLT